MSLRLRTREQRKRALWPWAAGSVFVAAWFEPFVAAQSEGYLMQTSPHPVYSTPHPAVYNLKLGRMVARLRGGVQVEFNDNINLANRGALSDVSVAPSLEVGFMYPLNKEHLLQLDLGVGYRWYLNHPSVSYLVIAPKTDSRFDYRLLLGKLQLDFHDMIRVQVDPVRPDISGVPGRLLQFHRLFNTAGVFADWRPVRKWGVVAGYDYGLDRSLNNEFTELDRDDHIFTLGTYYELTPKLTLGVNGMATWSFYRRHYQNDGVNYMAGPFFIYRASRYLTFDGSAGYAISRFDDNGQINDRSEFRNVAFTLGVRHTLNRTMSHTLRVSHGVGVGYGSNFTETWGLQYGYNWRLSRALTLDALFSFEDYRASSLGGDTGQRYLFYVGTGYRLSRRWNSTLSYSLSWKDSALPGRDYTQNRVALGLTRDL